MCMKTPTWTKGISWYYGWEHPEVWKKLMVLDGYSISQEHLSLGYPVVCAHLESMASEENLLLNRLTKFGLRVIWKSWLFSNLSCICFFSLYWEGNNHQAWNLLMLSSQYCLKLFQSVMIPYRETSFFGGVKWSMAGDKSAMTKAERAFLSVGHSLVSRSRIAWKWLFENSSKPST